MRLDIGATGTQKVLSSILLVFTLILCGALLGSLLSSFSSLSGSAGFVVGLVVMTLLFGPFFGLFLLRMLRTGAWLEGTTLVVRSTFRTQRSDLAAAPEVLLDSVAETTMVSMPNGAGGTTTFPAGTGRQIPRLVARDDRGRTLRLPLRTGRGSLLPPPQLHALAAAIDAGHRPHPDGERTHQIAQALTQLADNPLTPLL